jgi:hypothetical protein
MRRPSSWFIQERPGHYRVLVTGARARNDPAELTAALHTILGADAEIRVEAVERIPRGANQKYQAIVVAETTEPEAARPVTQ